MGLSGKVVAVTGGAQGIGAATAKALAAAGAKVAVGDLDTGLAAWAPVGAVRMGEVMAQAL